MNFAHFSNQHLQNLSFHNWMLPWRQPFVHRTKLIIGHFKHNKWIKSASEPKENCTTRKSWKTCFIKTFKVNCRGFRRMWITYSCQLGFDRTTANTNRPAAQIVSQKHCQNNRRMVSKDIPLDSGWIRIRCSGNCPIVINKVKRLLLPIDYLHLHKCCCK